MNTALVTKYEQMFFLEGVEEPYKSELSQLYADFTNFLRVELKGSDTVYYKHDINIMFIPLIKKLYLEYNEVDYKMVYRQFNEWYENYGVILENNQPTISDLDFMSAYISYYQKNNKILN